MKSKYIKPIPAIRSYSNGTKDVVGARPGPKSADNLFELVRPQAQTLVAKFGGPRELARILRQCSDNPKDHITPSTIYRWMYPRSRGGRGGEIPLESLQIILKCARLAGVMLKTEDIYPNLVGHELVPLDEIK